METIEDILKEMRNAPSYIVDDDTGGCRMVMLETLVGFANSIEAAYKSQLTSGAMCTMSCRATGDMLSQYMESEKRLAKENARLKAALKPVLEADTSVVLNFEETQIVTGHDVAISALYSIDEAKRIYNECKEESK